MMPSIAGRAPWMPMLPWDFDVRELGEDRAFAAARRAEQMSETGFAKMTDFDGTRARSEIWKAYAG